MQTKNITYSTFDAKRIDEVIAIYRESEWMAYLQDESKLIRAFNQSLYVFGAFHEEQLIGFIRVVGDGEHIVLVQDLIVKKRFRQNGIGTSLFQNVWNLFPDVRMFCVITDSDDDLDNRFYQSFGMKPLISGNMISYYR